MYHNKRYRALKKYYNKVKHKKNTIYLVKFLLNTTYGYNKMYRGGYTWTL